MNTAELVDVVSKNFENMSKSNVKSVVQVVFDTIKSELAKDGSVTITSFGIFEARQREERTGFNPKTKETLIIPAKRYPAFRASKALKEALED